MYIYACSFVSSGSHYSTLTDLATNLFSCVFLLFDSFPLYKNVVEEISSGVLFYFANKVVAPEKSFANKKKSIGDSPANSTIPVREAWNWREIALQNTHNAEYCA